MVDVHFKLRKKKGIILKITLHALAFKFYGACHEYVQMLRQWKTLSFKTLLGKYLKIARLKMILLCNFVQKMTSHLLVYAYIHWFIFTIKHTSNLIVFRDFGIFWNTEAFFTTITARWKTSFCTCSISTDSITSILFKTKFYFPIALVHILSMKYWW
jgi:hypothetical protein